MAEAKPTLYRFIPYDRSGRVAWLLEELGMAYEAKEMDMGKGETQTPEFLQRSPMGKIPAIDFGDTTAFESAAILSLLAERDPESRFAPPPAHPERARYLSWMFFGTATFDPVAFELVRPDLNEEEKEGRLARARSELPRILDAIQTNLGDRKTLLEFGFSPVDILLGSCLFYVRKELGEYPILKSYLDSLQARPAAQAAGLFPG